MEKRLDGNYTRMSWAILNKSWRQHTTKQQLYGHLPLIAKTVQVRRIRHTGHCGPLHMVKQRQDDQLEPTYNSSWRPAEIDVRWRRSGRRSGRSVVVAWHNYNDDMKKSWKKQNNPKFDGFIMRVNVECFGSNNLLQGFKFMKNVVNRVMVLFGLVRFYGISTFVGYLTPNSVYTYIHST